MTPDAAIATLARRRADAEVALLAAVAPNHASGINVARSVGVTHHAFAADDTRWLWLALEEARLWPRPRAAWACAAALRQTGHWGRAAGPNFGPLWHEAGLLRLFTGRYDGRLVRVRAAEVLELSRRSRLAEWHARRAIEVASGVEEEDERKAG